MSLALAADKRVADHLRCARVIWHGGPDIPDPLRYRDVLASPPNTGQVVRARIASNRPHGQPRRLEFPKPDGTENRVMRVLDPFAQIIFRIQVGRVVEAADASLRAEVLHARVGIRYSAWFTKPWRTAQQRRREFIDANREQGEFNGFGLVDMRSHYETVRVESLRRLLYACGCNPNSVEDLVGFLEGLHAIPGVAAGLPVGPEASAPLGTLALRSIDRRLVERAVVFVRYMDDYTVLADSRESFEDHAEVMDEQAHVASQAVNRAKLDYTEFDAIGGSMGSASTEDEEWADSEIDPLFELAAAIDAADEKSIPKWLGRLRHAYDPRAARLLEGARWVVHQLPRQVAQYLDALAPEISDWDWVREELLGCASTGRPAPALHLASVLPSSEIPAGYGTELWKVACSMDVRNLSPVRAMLFASAGRSEERSKIRVRRALDAADSLGDLNERRALVGSLRSAGGLSGIARAGVTHLGKVDPELEPTTSWVLAA